MSLVRILLLQFSALVVLLVLINGVSAWHQRHLGIHHLAHCRTHFIPTAPCRGTIPSYQIHSRDIHGICYSSSLAGKDGINESKDNAHNNNEYNSQLLLGGRLSTPSQDLKTLLDRMVVYFESMVDPDTSRFFLLSYPQQALPSNPPSMSMQAVIVSVNTRQESFSHVDCPLRDLGSAWDATKALQVLRHYGDNETEDAVPDTNTNINTNHCRLKDAILQTTKHYSLSLVLLDGDNCNAMHLSQEVLGEPPNIAHNALLLVTLIGSEELDLFDDDEDNGNKYIMDRLARGILFLQRADGAFRPQFPRKNNNDNNDDEDDVYGGIEFFPGEAMTALMEVYLHSSREPSTTCPSLGSEDTLDQILPAMLHALRFYRAYYEEGRNQNTIDANYSIWQVQAFARLVFALRQHPQHQQQQQQQQDYNNPSKQEKAVGTATVVASTREASEYCLDLCMDILRSPAWKLLSRGRSFYPNLSTVEIACGLDALYQGAVVLDLQQRDKNDDAAIDQDNDDNNYNMMSVLFARHIDEAVAFLKWSQDRVPTDAVVGYGGLGHGGYRVMEQRLDVTGHALSAVANLIVVPQ
jgi:hypothetical protein